MLKLLIVHYIEKVLFSLIQTRHNMDLKHRGPLWQIVPDLNDDLGIFNLPIIVETYFYKQH